MPVFVRSGAQWVESTPFARNGSVWTGESDSLYARDAGTWKLIHPDPAAVGDLLPVEGLAVTSGPTDRAVTVGWTNPTQPTITPTDVQVRVAELGAVWTEYAYPITSAAWASLDADTEYVVQVRLIRRVDGIVTDTSPVRHVQFTTDPAPIGAPAPDPGGSGGDTTFPWTGSTGNPTAPGTNDGCWWEIVVQVLNDNAASWSDTAITDTVAGDADSWEVDLSSLDSGRIYRTCRREACDTDTDGVADTWGDWECGLPFPAPTDWDAVCGGFADSTNITAVDATADAVFRYPYLCKNSDSNQMVMLEEVSGVELARGPGFYSFFTDSAGEKGVKAAPGETGAPWLIVGALTAVASMLVAEQDWTILSRFRATSDFTASSGRVSTIGVFGGVVTVSLTESAAGWTPTAAVLTDDGIKILTGSEITYTESTTHGIAVRWDDDGNLELLVDGVSADTEDVSLIDIYESPSLAAYNGAPGGLAIMQQLGWDRALTDEELEEYAIVEPDNLVAEYLGTVSGSPVDTWFDETDTSADMVQTGTSRPTVVDGIVTFDGVNDRMAGPSLIPFNCGNFTVFFVLEHIAYSAPYDQFMILQAAGAAAGFSIYRGPSGMEMHAYPGSAATNGSVKYYTPPTLGQKHVIACRGGGTNATTILRQNGVQLTPTGNPYSNNPGSAGALAYPLVGASLAGTNAAQIKVHAIRVYSRALSDIECAIVEGIIG